MTRLELGPIGAWGHLDTFATETARSYVRRIDELGYSAFWVPETVGREPFTLLGMLAAETSRLVLGTSIINIWGRDAQATRMGAMTLSEATGGRFALGLGVSHPHLGKLRGHDYVRPLSHMREYLAAYRAAIYRGPRADPAPEPPVLLAALRERMTDLAATEADGAFPHLVTAERVAWMRDRLDAARSDVRPILAVSLPVALGDGDAARAAARAFLTPYLRAPNYQASWELQGFDAGDWGPPISDRMADAMVAVGSAAAARERIAALHAAGADHVAILPLALDGATEHLGTLEALA
jgi:probable F420-dependent oxidoreductase